jgi:hypothetical protein
LTSWQVPQTKSEQTSIELNGFPSQALTWISLSLGKFILQKGWGLTNSLYYKDGTSIIRLTQPDYLTRINLLNLQMQIEDLCKTALV